jgi:hypothetical protein
MDQTPTLEQYQAIREWANFYGRNWKAPLRESWITGNYGMFEDIAGPLQQLRNTFGPSWLVKFRLAGGCGPRQEV